MQNTLNIVRMQSSNLVHHAVHDELSALSGSLFLKHIDEHDVHHSLHQDVCTIRPHIVDAFNPIGIVIVFLYAKLQAECVAQRNCCSTWLVLQLMRKTFEVSTTLRFTSSRLSSEKRFSSPIEKAFSAV